MCSFITVCRSSWLSKYQSALFVNGYTTRYFERSPLKSDCSCGVGRLTYCDGRMMPRKLCRGAIHVPIPVRSAAAIFSSSASTLGARLHSIMSTPAFRPIIEYVNVVTSDLADSAAQNSSAERQRSSRVWRRHAGSSPRASACTYRLAVAKARSRARGFTERPIEARGVLGRVSHDRGAANPGGVETGAKRRDLSVHHGARPDDVRSRFCVGDRSRGQPRQRGVVVDFLSVEHTAVAVRRVLAQADVGGQRKRQAFAAQQPQRLGYRASRIVGARAVAIF